MGNNQVKVEQRGFDDDSRKSQIDVQTKQAISGGYSIEDELKIIRTALVAMGCKDKDFLTMNDFISNLITTGKADKTKFKATDISINVPTHVPTYPDAPVNLKHKEKLEQHEALNNKEVV